MCVAKCVKTTPRDPQRIQDRPQVILHDFVGRGGPSISCHKEETRPVGLPVDLIVLEHGEQRARNGQDGLAGFTLGSLYFPVPCRAPNVEYRPVKVDVDSLQPEYFAGAQAV
jgi:hypothetical protein